ncbi:hypothetical protein BDW59DRAFT_162357 [Aspergillus cavernicola]|uniref:Zn(2)-C6 fungal-type domain-containing protein n=1 Tax=Aspergillus cavernicola TaxID=176166 RepID=A0ABR4I9S5_9EURO
MLSLGSGGDRKRWRIAIACNECRDRKRKCDGVKPVCGSCAKRTSTTQCAWEEGRNDKGWSHSRIQQLEQGQVIEDTDNVAARPSARRTSQGESADPPLEEAEGSGLRVHDQPMAPPGMVDMLAENNTMRAPSTDISCHGSTAREHGDATGPSSTLRFLSHAFQDKGISVGGSSHPSSLAAPKSSFSLAGHRLSVPPRNKLTRCSIVTGLIFILCVQFCTGHRSQRNILLSGHRLLAAPISRALSRNQAEQSTDYFIAC